MEKFRKSILRRFFTTVFILSVLSIQTQTLYACNLMDSDGVPQATCCCDEHMENGCPMGGGCHFPPGEKPTGCCDIKVEVVMQDATLTSTTDVQFITQLNAPQPPPAIITEIEISLDLSGMATGIGIQYHPPPFWSKGTHTYLITQRFRI